jgi:hypothetical protein
LWRTVTALDAGQPESEDPAADSPQADWAPGAPVLPTDPVEQLAAMYAGGLPTYALPAWSTIRWQGIEPRTVAALSAGEVAALDRLYRSLRDVTDLYGRVATITPDDWNDLQKNMGGRFWNLDLARERKLLFARLSAAVARVLDTPDPLPGAITTDK